MNPKTLLRMNYNAKMINVKYLVVDLPFLIQHHHGVACPESFKILNINLVPKYDVSTPQRVCWNNAI